MVIGIVAQHYHPGSDSDGDPSSCVLSLIVIKDDIDDRDHGRLVDQRIGPIG